MRRWRSGASPATGSDAETDARRGYSNGRESTLLHTDVINGRGQRPRVAADARICRAAHASELQREAVDPGVPRLGAGRELDRLPSIANRNGTEREAVQ